VVNPVVAALRRLGAVVPDEFATVPVTGCETVVGAVMAGFDSGRAYDGSGE
jgi:hypothetical protein